MKTQVITLDKLEKFLNIRDRKIVSIVPHTYIKSGIVEDGQNRTAQILKSVFVIYQEI